MIKPPVKATDAFEKPPAAKPLRSRWILEDDPKPIVVTGKFQFVFQFLG